MCGTCRGVEKVDRAAEECMVGGLDMNGSPAISQRGINEVTCRCPPEVPESPMIHLRVDVYTSVR